MSKCSADLCITEQLINLVCPSCLFLEHSLSTFKPKYRNSCLVCWLCTFALNWAVWEGVAVSLPDTKYVRNCDLAWVMMPLLFFIFPSPLPQISELPEREEGEGEETPNFSHWGPPRTYVHMITFLLRFFGFFLWATLVLIGFFFFLSSSASNFRVPVYLELSWRQGIFNRCSAEFCLLFIQLTWESLAGLGCGWPTSSCSFNND